jgi:tRNA (guanine-N1)-methyltransferase
VLLAIVVLPHDLKGLALQGKLLLGGNHAAIEKWRKEQQLERTTRRRPDLLRKNDPKL